MKHLLIILALLGSTVLVSAQTQGKTFKIEGKTITSTSSRSSKSFERETGYMWVDSNGNPYPVFMGPSGSCYIKRVSKKTGKEYKQYLGEEISKEVCKHPNVKYTSK